MHTLPWSAYVRGMCGSGLRRTAPYSSDRDRSKPIVCCGMCQGLMQRVMVHLRTAVPREEVGFIQLSAVTSVGLAQRIMIPVYYASHPHSNSVRPPDTALPYSKSLVKQALGLPTSRLTAAQHATSLPLPRISKAVHHQTLADAARRHARGTNSSQHPPAHSHTQLQLGDMSGPARTHPAHRGSAPLLGAARASATPSPSPTPRATRATLADTRRSMTRLMAKPGVAEVTFQSTARIPALAPAVPVVQPRGIPSGTQSQRVLRSNSHGKSTPAASILVSRETAMALECSNLTDWLLQARPDAQLEVVDPSMQDSPTDQSTSVDTTMPQSDPLRKQRQGSSGSESVSEGGDAFQRSTDARSVDDERGETDGSLLRTSSDTITMEHRSKLTLDSGIDDARGQDDMTAHADRRTDLTNHHNPSDIQAMSELNTPAERRHGAAILRRSGSMRSRSSPRMAGSLMVSSGGRQRQVAHRRSRGGESRRSHHSGGVSGGWAHMTPASSAEHDPSHMPSSVLASQEVHPSELVEHGRGSGRIYGTVRESFAEAED